MRNHLKPVNLTQLLRMSCQIHQPVLRNLAGWVGATSLAVITTAVSAPAEPSKTFSGTGSEKTLSAQRRQVDQKAVDLIGAMSDLLANARAIGYEVDETRDIFTSTGIPLQLEHRIRVAGRRPDEMWLRLQGDAADREFWLRQGKATLYDKENNIFATMAVPGSIDQAVSILTKTYDVDLPTAQLLSQDLESILMLDVEELYYIGIGQVAGEMCHHILAREEEIDWQIWIHARGKPLPCKAVITYKRKQGLPSITSRFKSWDLAPPASSEMFQADIPNGIPRVEFQRTSVDP